MVFITNPFYKDPPTWLTCLIIVAGEVKLPGEELQSDDGVDDDDKHNKECDVEQWHHSLQDGVQHHLKA